MANIDINKITSFFYKRYKIYNLYFNIKHDIYSSQMWYTTIGLEVHAQMSTKTKMFSEAPANVFGRDSNTCVDLFDLGLPGTLPVLNRECVIKGVQAGIALNMKIHNTSRFDRKHYFYPDLPSNYQITQYFHPIATNGSLTVFCDDTKKKIRINRLHLESDAGKSMHSRNHSLIDFNRAGVPLMEIVTEPDMHDVEEAIMFFKTLQATLRAIGVSEANMEKGHMRADVNISISDDPNVLGTRVEIKNLNSTSFMRKAVDYEIKRQIEVLSTGKAVEQETRLYDQSNNMTMRMRGKEDAIDYCYMPDPDLLPIFVENSLIINYTKNLKNLPTQLCEKWIETLKLSAKDVWCIASDVQLSCFFIEASSGVDVNIQRKIARWILGAVLELLKNQENGQIPIQPHSLRKLVQMIENQTISGKIAKEIFPIMWNSLEEPDVIAEKHGFVQITDKNEIEKFSRDF